MNKTEKTVVVSTLENIVTNANKPFEHGSIDEWRDYAKKMETSITDGSHVIMKLVESNEGNADVVLQTLLYLEKHDYLDDEISDILGHMKNRKFTGE